MGVDSNYGTINGESFQPFSGDMSEKRDSQQLADSGPQGGEPETKVPRLPSCIRSNEFHGKKCPNDSQRFHFMVDWKEDGGCFRHEMCLNLGEFWDLEEMTQHCRTFTGKAHLTDMDLYHLTPQKRRPMVISTCRHCAMKICICNPINQRGP